jgi:hypothetical protein
MEKFWNIFWKTCGAAVPPAVVIGIIAGVDRTRGGELVDAAE